MLYFAVGMQRWYAALVCSVGMQHWYAALVCSVGMQRWYAVGMPSRHLHCRGHKMVIDGKCSHRCTYGQWRNIVGHANMRSILSNTASTTPSRPMRSLLWPSAVWRLVVISCMYSLQAHHPAHLPTHSQSWLPSPGYADVLPNSFRHNGLSSSTVFT